MAPVNTRPVLTPIYTHEGALAAQFVGAREQLWRSVGATLLWEPQNYESGDSIANRIHNLILHVDDTDVADLARITRTNLKLRDTPLWMANGIARKHRGGKPIAPKLLSSLIADIVRRPDQATELLAQYWKMNGRPLQTIAQRTVQPKRLPWQMRVGLGLAFQRFNEYQLAKYARSEAIKLRDVLFLVHAKPRDEAQAALWKRLIAGELATPDTWEVALSTGKDPKETWQRLIGERKLGYLALLMNLRNSLEAGLDEKFLRDALVDGAKGSWALPYRFISAARAAPKLEPALSEAMRIAVSDMPKLRGRTLLVVDVSGSMQYQLSEKSKLNRVHAAGALAVTAASLCEQVSIYATAGNDVTRRHNTAEIPARADISLIDALERQMHVLGGGGIFLTQCMDWTAGMELARPFDRVLVFTDEVDCDIDPAKAPKNARKLAPQGRNYIMNVASYEHGIASDGGWQRISGYSGNVLNWIAFDETGEALVSGN